MIGVILWSDQATGRAVVWCEDHSGLAYLSGTRAAENNTPFSVGDIVDVIIELSGVQRLVSEIRKVSGDVNGLVPNKLNNSQGSTASSVVSGSNVIPMRKPCDTPVETATNQRKVS